jgi:hypothetical protein
VLRTNFENLKSECDLCKKEDVRTTRPKGNILPRFYPACPGATFGDAKEVTKVMNDDINSNFDAIVIIGTALDDKRRDIKLFATQLCEKAKKHGAVTMWINLKPPPIHLFNLEIQEDCQEIARQFQSDPKTQVDMLTKVNDQILTLALGERQFRQRIQALLGIEENNSTRRHTSAQARQTQQHEELPTLQLVDKPLDELLPPLALSWESDMSERLQNVVTGGLIASVKLDYNAYTVGEKLWRLKPEYEIDDDIVNAYLALVPLGDENYIAPTVVKGRKARELKNHLEMGHRVFVLIHLPGHWTYAVLQRRHDKFIAEYFNSLRGPLITGEELCQKIGLQDVAIEVLSGRAPEQKLLNDCGPCVILGIRTELTFGRPLSQLESDKLMPTARTRVLAELIARKLNPSEGDYAEFKKRETEAEREESKALTDTEASERSESDDDDDSEYLGRPNPRKKRTPTPPLTLAAEIGLKFATEESITKMLKHAMFVAARSHVRYIKPKGDLEFADLWYRIKAEPKSLNNRYDHFQFAIEFANICKTDIRKRVKEKDRVTILESLRQRKTSG